MLAAPAEAQDKSAKPAAKLYTITLAVSPSPAPAPVLKYELLPPARMRVPGNAAVDYQRAALLLPQWPRDAKDGQKRHEDIDRWFAASFDDFPIKEVEEFLKSYRQSFAALDRAARAERCDWQLRPYLSPSTWTCCSPRARSLGNSCTTTRSASGRIWLPGNFDAAIGDLQSGFRLAKDMAESPTTIRMLIGIALAAIATGSAEQWVGRPDAPNLYWALDALPKPFIDPRPALEGEAAFVGNSLPEPEELMRVPSRPIAPNAPSAGCCVRCRARARRPPGSSRHWPIGSRWRSSRRRPRLWPERVSSISAKPQRRSRR